MKSVQILSVVPLLALVTTALWSQDSLPNCVSGSFSNNEAIAVARIDSVRLGSEPDTATLTVQEYLRGGGSAGDTLEVPVDWNGDLRVAIRPPVWYKISPDVGKQVLLFLGRSQANTFARCVVDLSRNSVESLRAVKRLVALQKLSPDKDEAELEQALADPSQAVRQYAHDRLTAPNRRAADTRERLFERYSQAARDSTNPQRMEAISRIESDYDPILIESPVNYRILSFMADLAGDPDVRVRDAAVQYLYSKFFSDLKRKPDPGRLQPQDREKIHKQLQQDIAESRTYSDEAQKLLTVLGGNQ